MIGISSDESLKNQGGWMLTLGTFLIFGGFLGVMSDPVTAKTALLLGSLFGTLSAFVGILMRKGIGFARWLGLSLLGVVAGAYTWRTAVSWEAVNSGDMNQLSALLITVTLLAAIASIFRLLKG